MAASSNVTFSFGVDLQLSDPIDKFLSDNKAKETVYNTTSHLNRLKSFMKEMNKNRDIWEIPAPELDKIMSHFFMTAKKVSKNSIQTLGELYQPDTLSNMRNAWQRALENNGSKLNIKTDAEFQQSRKVLATRRKQLTQQGLGNKPLATRPLDQVEVDKLFTSGYFGISSPLSLQRAIWWKITTNFGYRARDESRKLCFGDIKLCTDNSGKKYLEWDKERGSKTRTGERSNSHQREFNPRAYETSSQQCPVAIYETFVSKRPADSKEENSPFFLAMVPERHISDGKPWFFNRPLGKNMLGDFMKNARSLLQNTNTSRSKIANHSARKTCINTLLNIEISPLHVSQLSGHKNLDSLKSYHTASLQKQNHMSNILNSNSDCSSSSSCSIS